MKSRWLIVALALVGAVAFALAVQGGRWWSVESVAIGPFGSRQCFAGECRPTSLAWLGGGSRWARLGTAAWAGGMLSMLGLSALAAAIAARRAARLLARTTLVAIATATLAGALFVFDYPGVQGASVDRGIPLFAAAIASGAAAALLALRRARTAA